MLTKIRIVLINTSHPGNIGAAARAMKTMGLSQLVLVDPKFFPHPDATAMAAGADDILANAIVTTSLDTALADCHLVIGTSARIRSLSWPMLSPSECATKAYESTHEGDVAILFGREHSGLTNQELQRCHFQVQIPCNPEFSSLNIAAAVQVIAYEIFARSQQVIHATKIKEDWVSAEEIEMYYQHLQSVLAKINFLKLDNPDPLMSRIRRLYARTRLDRDELNILRGMLSAIEKYIA